MQVLKADHPALINSKYKFISAAIILLFLLVVALYIINIYRPSQPAPLPESTVTISQSVLEEKYGLRVNLVAVTAAGGLVDLRLKIIDGEKAKLLLQDKKNFPSLLISDGNITLNVPAETKSQEIKFEEDGNLLLLFANAGNVVKPGTSVTLIFGDIALEPIAAR